MNYSKRSNPHCSAEHSVEALAVQSRIGLLRKKMNKKNGQTAIVTFPYMQGSGQLLPFQQL